MANENEPIRVPASTKLRDTADKQLNGILIPKNTYKESFAYGPNNPDALSNGDEFGKGELNGSIGSKTDISVRTKLAAINIYNENNQYKSPE
jgi:hypothetical protein